MRPSRPTQASMPSNLQSTFDFSFHTSLSTRPLNTLYEPAKMPAYGRGGAGNFQAVAQEKQRIAADPEAQESTEETSHPTTDYHSPDPKTEQYKRAGRGGAGNYYSADDAISSEKAEQSVLDAGRKQQAPAIAPPKYGRGGAGNLAFAGGRKGEEDERVQTEVDKMRERVSKAVENHVEEGLAFPEKAKVVDY